MPNDKSLQEQIDSVCESGMMLSKSLVKLAETISAVSMTLGGRITAIEHRISVVEKWQSDEETSQMEQAEQIGPGDSS